jgi:hypothetical protein
MAAMSTPLNVTQSFPADPAAVRAMMCDAAYVQRKSEETGGFDTTVVVSDEADGSTVVTCTRSFPADVPSYAKSFVGDALTVTEVQTWAPIGADGSASANVTVDFHAPIAYAGTITLATDGSGTTAGNVGAFKANVPLVGGKVERVALDQTERYLAKEVEVAAAWLNG